MIDERKENNNSNTEEITINGENYKITIYEKDKFDSFNDFFTRKIKKNKYYFGPVV